MEKIYELGQIDFFHLDSLNLKTEYSFMKCYLPNFKIYFFLSVEMYTAEYFWSCVQTSKPKSHVVLSVPHFPKFIFYLFLIPELIRQIQQTV